MVFCSLRFALINHPPATNPKKQITGARCAEYNEMEATEASAGTPQQDFPNRGLSTTLVCSLLARVPV
jgi:hypothetical protein